MAEERLRFLADASILLAGSLDISETLRQLAHAIVPRFADWCTISLREDDGVMRRIIGVHRDPAKAPVMERYRSLELIQYRDFRVAIRLGGSRVSDEGVLVSHGDSQGGYVLYVEGGKAINFSLRRL